MPPKNPPVPAVDWACRDFQYLEDLATAYWHSEVLFAALELRLFDSLEARPAATPDLARAGRCHTEPLDRLLSGLAALGLVRQHEGLWSNAQLARTYLVSGKPAYLGDFLLYRRYLQDPWRGLARRVAADPDAVDGSLSAGDSYAARNRRYVRSMDALARRKAEEIFAVLPGEAWSGPVLDVGGGAGALCRRAMRETTDGFAVLLDLPEVLSDGRDLYPSPVQWHGIQPLAVDVRKPFPFPDEGRFGLVILSNILHAYSAGEAQALLQRAAGQLCAGGLLLIHDYFPDGPAHDVKGALYDLNMLLNTYDGRCHRMPTVMAWLEACGLERPRLKSLPSDSDLIIAGGRPGAATVQDSLDDLLLGARRLGFLRAAALDAAAIETAPWVRIKCRYGCARHGRGLTCPPHGRDAAGTAELLRSYRTAILLEGEPPGRDFHGRLLELEKQAFLAGYPKALVFGAGPCTICETCPADGGCRFPEKARPSMEASGIDVYAAARAAGIGLAPVARQGGHVKYIGLLLVE